MKNIQSVIESIRAEMEILWEKCFYSPDQRQAFTACYSGKPAFTLNICYGLHTTSTIRMMGLRGGRKFGPSAHRGRDCAGRDI